MNNRNRWVLQRCVAVVAAVLALSAATANAEVVYAWGLNHEGEIGDGTTTTPRLLPAPVGGLSTNISAIAAAGEESLAIQSGAVYAWGGGAGLNPDGSAFDTTSPVAVTGLSSGVTAIASGQAHNLALRNGAVYAWGWNGEGELGNDSTMTTHSPVPVIGLGSGVTAIAGGDYHNLAIQNGALYAWGSNGDGELGDGSNIDRHTPVPVTGLSSGVTAIAGGWNFSLAVQNGQLFSWGANGIGQLGNGSSDFNLHATATPVNELSSGVTAIAAGGHHALAVKDGLVYAWGYNGYGELGDGSPNDHFTPQPIDGLSDVVQVAAGEDCSYALSADGRLWAWGDNGLGELGLGDTDPRITPTEILPPDGFRFSSIDADALGAHAVASLVAVPEPGSLALMLIGAAICVRRKRVDRSGARR